MKGITQKLVCKMFEEGFNGTEFLFWCVVGSDGRRSALLAFGP